MRKHTVFCNYDNVFFHNEIQFEENETRKHSHIHEYLHDLISSN